MKAVYCLKTENGKVMLRVIENRKRPSKSEVMVVNVELDPINADSFGKSLIHMARRAVMENAISDVNITAACKTEIDEQLSLGKRIGAVRVIRAHTGLGLKEACYYLDKLLSD